MLSQDAAHLVSRRGLIASLAAIAPAFQSGGAKPNILVILADDLGQGDLRCYNPQSRIPTPELDRLARQGMRFTDAHSPSSVCTPTRYGLLTGRYCWRSRLQRGVLWGYDTSLIEEDRPTVASVLRGCGYHTAAIGKWHLGFQSGEKVDYAKPLRPGPLDCGFDRFFGIPASLDMDPYIYVEGDRAVAQATDSVAERLERRGVFWRGGPRAPGFRHEDVLPELTNRARQYLRDRARERNPFFLYWALTSPHTPWLPDAKRLRQSKAGDYGAFVSMTDGAIGQVLRTLRETGQEKNTLVIVTSDNGAHWLPNEIAQWGHRANGNWRGQKADIWEAGHRVPFLARWPGTIASGAVSNQLLCLTDLYATFSELAGAPAHSVGGEDSFSILPLLQRTPAKTPLRDHVVHHSLHGHFALREGTWKLHTSRGSGGFTEPIEYRPKAGEPAGELFNLDADPGESMNLWKERPDLVVSMERRLAALRAAPRSTPQTGV